MNGKSCADAAVAPVRRTVVVTGVAGFLGSHLLDRLLAGGCDVIGIDNLSMGTLRNIAPHMNSRTFRFLNMDVTDPSTFGALEDDVDCVVHLAAFKIPRYGRALDTLRINAKGTENVLDFARRVGGKCVLASTSDVYGRNPNPPFTSPCCGSSAPTGPGTTSAGGVDRSRCSSMRC